MFWFFMSVVLVLAVLHPGFRNVLLKGLAILTGVVCLSFIGVQIAAHPDAAKPSATAYPQDTSKPFDPDAYLVWLNEHPDARNAPPAGFEFDQKGPSR